MLANPNLGQYLVPVSWAFTGGQWCCGSPVVSNGSITCAPGAGPFTFPNGYVITDRSATVTTSSTASETPAASTTTVTLLASASSCPSTSNHDAAIGAGVGVPLGALLVAALCWGAWERRQRGRQQANMQMVQPAYITTTGVKGKQRRIQYAEVGGNPGQLNEIGPGR